jgi:hypothetical protein
MESYAMQFVAKGLAEAQLADNRDILEHCYAAKQHLVYSV